MQYFTIFRFYTRKIDEETSVFDRETVCKEGMVERRKEREDSFFFATTGRNSPPVSRLDKRYKSTVFPRNVLAFF